MWWLAIGLIVGLLIGLTMMPKTPGVKPPGINDVQMPTINEGREKPVLFGTRDIKGALIHWWGQFSVLPVKRTAGKK